jgi:hypothetical protein
VYKYRLEQTLLLSSAEKELINDLRKNGDANDVARNQTEGRLPKAAPAQSGDFVVFQGAIITETGLPEEGKRGVADEAAGLSFPSAETPQASGGLQNLPDEQVISGNLTVYNSVCVGFDCLTNETYGADTIRLKENNLRIHFDDTSTAGSFPRNDWRIVANSNLNGGASYLAFEDSTAGRQVFTVSAGARSNALYVDSQGDVGLGTSTPVVELHVVSGDTPTLRLEQNGSSGFGPQTWDVAGNETSFFVRDATNGSTLPFRIRPGAASQSLVIDTDNDVGVGILSPDAALHVFGSDANTQLHVEETNTAVAARTMMVLENNGGVRFNLVRADTGDTWQFTALANFNINLAGDADNEFQLTPDGDLIIEGEITTSGSCSGGCDFVFSPEYDLPTIEEHAAQMWTNSYLPAIGPTPEDGPFNLTKKVGGMLNELEKAHIYIDQLNQRLVAKENELEAVRLQTETLQRTVEELKQLLSQ